MVPGGVSESPQLFPFDAKMQPFYSKLLAPSLKLFLYCPVTAHFTSGLHGLSGFPCPSDVASMWAGLSSAAQNLRKVLSIQGNNTAVSTHHPLPWFYKNLTALWWSPSVSWSGGHLAYLPLNSVVSHRAAFAPVGFQHLQRLASRAVVPDPPDESCGFKRL